MDCGTILAEGMESVFVAVRGAAQRVAAAGAAAWDMAIPLGRSNLPPEQLFRQGAVSWWMPEPDVMELPNAAALYPSVYEHMRKLNANISLYAERRVPAASGRGTDRMNVLAPYIARLFAAMMEKAEILACWKIEGSALDPGNYSMPAISCTFKLYRPYADVLMEVVTRWCQGKNKIPNAQFGFYPGRNTLQPVFILRHLQHAAQAYDTIPREALWTHLQRILMPTCLLAISKASEYILVDGCKQKMCKGLSQAIEKSLARCESHAVCRRSVPHQ
eukprot:1161171-Pelagomonas_calceolata.AAC.17